MRSFIEIFFAIVIFICVKFLSGVTYSGPAAIGVTLIAVTAILYARGETWRAMGLKFPSSFSGFLSGTALTVLIVVIVAGVALLAIPLLSSFLGPPPLNPLTNIATLQQYLTIMAIAWTSAAIGEELLFRGFLMNRLHDVFGSSKSAWVGALLVQTVLFGLAHYYQGLFGIILTGIVGFVFGAFYLLDKRNLVPLIAAHGLVDTISLTQFYLNGPP